MKENAIFIVDDDEGHAILVQSSLEESGIANPIRWFSSGDAVIDYIFDDPIRRPLVILLDLNMPGLRGTDVLRRLKEDERSRSIPVIVVTTSAEGPEIDECYALGCNLYITKPVRHEEFIHAMRTLGFVLQIVHLPAPVS